MFSKVLPAFPHTVILLQHTLDTAAGSHTTTHNGQEQAVSVKVHSSVYTHRVRWLAGFVEWCLAAPENSSSNAACVWACGGSPGFRGSAVKMISNFFPWGPHAWAAIWCLAYNVKLNSASLSPPWSENEISYWTKGEFGKPQTMFQNPRRVISSYQVLADFSGHMHSSCPSLACSASHILNSCLS